MEHLLQYLRFILIGIIIVESDLPVSVTGIDEGFITMGAGLAAGGNPPGGLVVMGVPLVK